MIRIVSRAALCGLLLVARAASAQDTQPEDFAIHGQATVVAQGVGGFASPYSGANSLTPRQVKETADITAFIGARAWTGGELWVNPEIDQGFGLSNTLGVAGFPSAEAYKVGKAEPYFRLQRAFSARPSASAARARRWRESPTSWADRARSTGSS